MDSWDDSQVDVCLIDDLIHSQECYIICADQNELDALIYALWNMPLQGDGFRMNTVREDNIRSLFAHAKRPWGLRYHFYVNKPSITICAGNIPTCNIPEYNMSKFIYPPDLTTDEPEDMELSDELSMSELF